MSGGELSSYLGIYGGQGPNPAAALIKNGKLVAFAEEERFNRIKMAPSALPINSMLYCLNAGEIGFEQVSSIGFGWDCQKYTAELNTFYKQQKRDYPFSDSNYYQNQQHRLGQGFDPDRISNEIALRLFKKGLSFPKEKLKFFPHHLCHASSTFFASGFGEAVIFVADGSGERQTTTIWSAQGEEFNLVKSFQLPHSLGGVYSTFTEFLGFNADQDEGKVMGLAPYGSYSEDLQIKLDSILKYDKRTGDFEVNPYLRFLGEHSFGVKFTNAFCDIFDVPRLQEEPITNIHKDLAFNLQWRLEQIACLLIERAVDLTGFDNVCIAGGVGMNCKMNGQVGCLPNVSQLYVQPASSDNGTALGAAYLAAREAGSNAFPTMKHVYLGPEYTNEEIVYALKFSKLYYRYSDNIENEVARILHDGKIVGWIQGRMEVGARALGNRSILANPTLKDMRERINREVKMRENWRPFCPSLPIECYEKYFGNYPVGEYMNTAYPVKEKYRDQIPAVVHVDGTARPQAVRREANPRFYDLLVEFEKYSSHPILLNTSFNIQGEPIVMSPLDAIRCFGSTGIDTLVINNYIVEKRVESIKDFHR